MKVTVFCLLRAVAVAVMIFFALFSSAAATGIVGLCSDCHTMHNSEQGQAVAKIGIGGSATSNTPATNLLRMDCIACHAQNQGSKIVTLPGGSQVPQVYHSDAFDLAAGNFRHLAEGGARKGHNVRDLFALDPNNQGTAPGLLGIGGHDFTNLTCAGAKGCHGTRSQKLGDGSQDGPRVGIAAISGAHHQSYDGAKDPAQITKATALHDGAHVADSYRFLRGLKGYGNEADRWQNVSAASHNEYFGSVAEVAIVSDENCQACHVDTFASGGWRLFTDETTLKIPNQSMSGFCSTCHVKFHTSEFRSTGENWASGAWLRHPSDYVIPDRGEYSAYTEYNITAPVARSAVYDSPSATVTPGTDMVMCLSCHMAHASPYDGMLRFDYQAMVAGQSEHNDGCVACHTSKGILPEGRGN